jgi:uncharacterized protein YfkK (UPF0435 family)
MDPNQRKLAQLKKVIRDRQRERKERFTPFEQQAMKDQFRRLREPVISVFREVS